MTIVTFEEGDESPNVRYTDNGDGSYTPIVDMGASVTLSGDISTVGPNISTGNNCGQITVTTAGTAVQGPNVALTNGVFINGHPANTGYIAVGNNGSNTVTTTSGFILGAGNADIWQVANLNELWFNSTVNGEKATWHKG
jgi:hypothetical protein